MVRVALNLAYLTEKDAKEFSFERRAFLGKLKEATKDVFLNMLNSKMH